MKRLPDSKRATILKCLCEGTSGAACARITGVDEKTVERLMMNIGRLAERYLDEKLVNLTCKRVQADEIWSFVKHKNHNEGDGRKLIHDPQEGDVWTWKAICPDTKLIMAYHVGGRTFENATVFCRKLAHRFVSAPQVSTDGLMSYQTAVAYAFGTDVDFGMVVKKYEKIHRGIEICVDVEKRRMLGNPEGKHICTSHIERANLSLRMNNRRFTRKTNGFSKKLENHRLMLAISLMQYNFCRKHSSLEGKTPAMAAGVTESVWTHEEMIQRLEAFGAESMERQFEEAFAEMEAF